MILNICRYQLPYIEYNLFRDYIAENLCVKRFEANNDCQGKCFLYGQFERINEADNSACPIEKKQITLKTDDCVIDSVAENGQNCDGIIHSTSFVCIYTAINSDIPEPPPERFA
jgi:hypothetical protein